jgi:flavin reductase ActVB
MLDGDFTVITVPGHAEADVQPAFQNPGLRGVTIDAFRHAMRKLPGGVVMVTARIGDRPWGLTISSCCSMTADPPQILISLQKRTASYQQILHDGCFGIGILGPEHRFLAELGSRPGVAKFIDEHCHNHTRERLASPVIVGALCHLDCRVTHTHSVGDHVLIIGIVENILAAEDDHHAAGAAARSPLVYFDREFWALGVRAAGDDRS